MTNTLLRLNSTLIKFTHAVPKGYCISSSELKVDDTYMQLMYAPWYVIGNADGKPLYSEVHSMHVLRNKLMSFLDWSLYSNSTVYVPACSILS